jgi:hypothetical protein
MRAPCRTAPLASRPAVSPPCSSSRPAAPALSTAAAVARGLAARATLGRLPCGTAPSQRALPPHPHSPHPWQPAATGGGSRPGVYCWTVDSVSWLRRSAPRSQYGVPPARPPSPQKPAGMGSVSVSGRSGRAWSPLRVRLRGVAAVGRRPLGPGCSTTPPPLLRAFALVPQMHVRGCPCGLAQTISCARGCQWRGRGGRDATLLLGFPWTSPNWHPTARTLYRYPGCHNAGPRGACGLHAVGGGVAFAPPASGWVRCSLRPPEMGALVEVMLGTVGIALGPLAGVGQDCLGWGAFLWACPFVPLPCCVLHCLLAACSACSFACCITLALSLSCFWSLRGSCGLHQGLRPP